MPLADGAPACPFVAFEDDRDERASVPDHRHRCYAESRPAPRALAHQEAYCLSSAFPVCPTFQDWARREAARARGASDRDGRRPAPAAERERVAEAGLGLAAAAAAATARGSDDEAADDVDADLGGGPDDGATPGSDARHREPSVHDGPVDDDDDRGLAGADAADLASAEEREAVRRNPPRDWSAPPPWLASSERGHGQDEDPSAPPFLGRRASSPGQGLAGSAADRLAGGDTGPEDDADSGMWVSSATARPVRAEPPRRSQPTAPIPADDPDDLDPGDEDVEDGEPRRPARRSRAYAQHLGGPNSPDWERPRRYEAYPTIRSRVGVPQVPRLALTAGAIVLIALALLFLPSLLNLGGGGTGSGPVGSAAPSGRTAAPSLASTQPAAPTPVVYTIKKGDTLSKIATRNGLTVDELLKANPSIKDPNKVSLGQQIIIPTPSQASDDAGSGTASEAP